MISELTYFWPLFQVWQMAENIYNDEEMETPAADGAGDNN